MATPQTLAGKVVLITGGTKGIGRSTVELLVSQGANIVATYGGDKASAEKFVQEVSAEKVTVVQADAASLADIDKVVKVAVDKHGKVDVLIANAATLSMTSVEHVTEELYQRTYDINVKGPMFLVQKALPHIPKGGRVVFMSTTQNFASTVTAPYFLYCSTKGAIDQMTRVLAKDLGARGITANAVAPGPTGTDLFFEGKSEQVLNMIKGLNPAKRIGEPHEVANVLAFLASEQSSWVNGQILKVNGGMYVG